MDSAAASPEPGPTIIRLPVPFDDGFPATEPIIVILALLAIVTAMAFVLLSTIGSAPV
ncbi:hypothetical protein ACVXZ4_17850 [Lacisediminihabitans sp. FW035]